MKVNKSLLTVLTILVTTSLSACVGDKSSYTTSDGTEVKVDKDLTETNIDYTKKDGTVVEKEYDKDGKLIKEDVYKN